MNFPEWPALLIAVTVGLAFWVAIELLMRWSAVRRFRDIRAEGDAGSRPDDYRADRQP